MNQVESTAKSQDYYKIRSSIQPYLLQHSLMRGTILACFGALLLILSGIFVPETLLSALGLPLFLIAFGVITLGLLPYRRLKRLEYRPHEIIISDEEKFLFAWEGNPLFTLPFASIEWMKPVKLKSSYGIAIKLKSHPPKKIVVQDRSFDLKHYIGKCQSSYSCDIFLPYFSLKGFHELNDFLNSSLQDVVQLD